MALTKTVLRILSAGNRRPTDARDTDPYRGVEMHVVLAHLKNEPVVSVRLTDAEALDLAASLVKAVAARAARD